MSTYDLIIIGGGLVGAGLAVALRDSGLRIALIEARLPTANDARLFALNHGSCQFLKNLGIWQKLSTHASPIHQVHVSHHRHFGAVRLKREEIGLSALGYVIPARFIEAALQEELSLLPTITLYQPGKLRLLKQDKQQVELMVETHEGESYLQSAVVIGADGTESTVRTLLNIETAQSDYQQSAIVTRTTLSRGHQQTAYERFHRQGTIAMLPLPNQECATIWTGESEQMAKLATLSDEAFLQNLQKVFGYRLGRLQSIHQRHLFPVTMLHAKKMLHQQVFLLGNSAHTMPPIAAQGFNLAIYEVATLVENIQEKTRQQLSFTSHDLQKVNELIKKQQSISMSVSHWLAKLFPSESTLFSFVLQAGMLGLDVTMPIKKRFMARMTGRSGRVPRLLLSTNH